MNKLNVASSIFREKSHREMPTCYIDAPSFFNQNEASKKAKQVVTSFTESYLSQYCSPAIVSTGDTQVSLNGIGDSDDLRTL
jgi:hypothetical protein